MPKVGRQKSKVADNSRRSSWRLAINIVDSLRMDDFMKGALLKPHLDEERGAIITDKSRIDEGAVAFKCDLLTAAAVCDTIRTHDKNAGDYPTRVYLCRGGNAWQKLPGHAILCDVIENSVILSPKWFGTEAVSITLPTTFSMVKLGRKNNAATQN